MTWEELFRNANITDPEQMERWTGRYPGGPDSMSDEEFQRNFPAINRTGQKIGPGRDPSTGVNPMGGGGLEGSYEDFISWTEGRIEPWMEETAPIRDTFRRWLDLGGVEAGAEGAIARGAEGAAQRAGEGAAGMGMQNSGMNQAMQGSIWGQTMPAILQNRSQNMATAGGVLSGLSSQLAGLLGGQMGAGSSAFGSVYGRSMGTPWSKGEEKEEVTPWQQGFAQPTYGGR